jgi:hypothetical protein
MSTVTHKTVSMFGALSLKGYVLSIGVLNGLCGVRISCRVGFEVSKTAPLLCVTLQLAELHMILALTVIETVLWQ